MSGYELYREMLDVKNECEKFTHCEECGYFDEDKDRCVWRNAFLLDPTDWFTSKELQRRLDEEEEARNDSTFRNMD